MTVRRKQSDDPVKRGGRVAGGARGVATPEREGFRTVLIPTVGWPTGDMAATSAKRPVKR
jgi:hypothetical protein